MLKANPFRRFRTFVRRLVHDRGGLAFVEFAYALPFLTVLGISGIELANMAIVHARVSLITSTVADGIARVRDRIDEVDINDVITGAKMSGEGINFTQHGRIIISTVEDNAATANPTTDQVITWQRCKGVKVVAASEYAGVQGQVLTTGVGPAGRQISAKPGNPVIFVETFYDYQPIFVNHIFGPITMKYKSAYSVRDRVMQDMQNKENLSGTALSTCGYFTA